MRGLTTECQPHFETAARRLAGENADELIAQRRAAARARKTGGTSA